MHLELTEDQTEAVRGSLVFSRRALISFLNSERSVKNEDKRAWAMERGKSIDAVLALMPEESK